MGIEEISFDKISRELKYSQSEDLLAAIGCGDIQKKIMGRSFDLRTREGNIEFEEAGGHDDKCTTVVGNGARWAAEILQEAQLK